MRSDVIGRGVAKDLYDAVEARARELGCASLSSDASDLAKRFFERQGWLVVRKKEAVLSGVRMTNYRMIKSLS